MDTIKIEIEVPEGKKAEWVNGVLTLIDDKKEDVRERIKTFEDACKELGESNELVLAHKAWENGGINNQPDIDAYMKLRIIVAALNEGWKPEFTDSEWRYYPWFRLYTKEEIEYMDKAEKARVVRRSNGGSDTSGWVAYAHADVDSSSTYARHGSRLALKNKNLAEYAGQQFIGLWIDYLL